MIAIAFRDDRPQRSKFFRNKSSCMAAFPEKPPSSNNKRAPSANEIPLSLDTC